jgi:hypothetical protein
MMPGNEELRAPAMAPPCSLIAGDFSPPSPPAIAVSRQISDLPPGLEVIDSASIFSKETLRISSIEPALQNVFRKYVFSF